MKNSASSVKNLHSRICPVINVMFVVVVVGYQLNEAVTPVINTFCHCAVDVFIILLKNALEGPTIPSNVLVYLRGKSSNKYI